MVWTFNLRVRVYELDEIYLVSPTFLIAVATIEEY
jgi:hypothetical protein